MSVLISNFQEISNSNRFRSITHVNTPVIGYDLPSTITKQGTKFGIDCRKDPFRPQGERTPSPTSYQLRSSFDLLQNSKSTSLQKSVNQSKSQSNGFFYAPRESYAKVVSPTKWNYYINNEFVPGPGQYDPVTSFNALKAGPRFSIKPKASQNMFKIDQNPGPGTYENVGIAPDGQYAINNYKSFNGPFFKKQIIEKNRIGIEKSPGPGQYFNEQGKDQSHYESVIFKGKPTTKFGTSKRDVFKSRSHTPGPGVYKLPSDFGHYVSKNSVESQLKSIYDQRHVKIQSIKPSVYLDMQLQKAQVQSRIKRKLKNKSFSYNNQQQSPYLDQNKSFNQQQIQQSQSIYGGIMGKNNNHSHNNETSTTAYHTADSRFPSAYDQANLTIN
ncbi:UNKNOWN [Stylonychia lemnae]|uniref:Sperm-tail PG-rich repeat protein n=1 Tax=Stylonychia lemnae TaxID=5949 RepID=A0A078A2I8_STYLE|nr:UNKNOWN [Stylonychia lemnae]|eukprot:CDW75753.1 UNKNOWN [Stylonychia lemnae]